MEKTCTYAIGCGFFQFLLPAPRTLSTLVEILFLIYDIYIGVFVFLLEMEMKLRRLV